MQSSSSGGPNRHFVLGGLAALPRCFGGQSASVAITAGVTPKITERSNVV
jgi:hypothetical protein